jgi:hypothetical protein
VYEKPTAPAGIGGVLDDGLRLWRLCLPLTWGLAMLAQAINTAPAILFPAAPVPQASADLALAQRAMAAVGAGSKYSLVALVFGMIAYGFTNAVLLRIYAFYQGKPMSFGEALSAGFGLVLRTFRFFLLLGLGFALAAALLIIPAIAMRGSASAGNQILMGLVLVIAGFVFIYVAVRLAVAYPAMIVDDLGVTSAISASWKMTKGFWWRVAVLISVLSVVILALGALLGVVAGGTAGLVGANKDIIIRVTQIANVIMYAFLGSLSPAVLLSVYNDLKLRRQGGDLADRVSALAAQ